MKSYLNASRQKILDHAMRLLETTLREFYGTESDHVVNRLNINPNDKGKLGNLVEVLHFGLALNQRPGPDFVAAGIELKTTGLKTLQLGQLVAKERLPLGMIDYMQFEDPTQWDFDTAGILQKSRILLLMVYLYEANVEIVDLLFKLIDFWEFPEADLEIIKQDWEHIIGKIRSGKAEDLSEGDTFYLGASTAGGGHGRVRPQPFSHKKAKPRKFSLKQPYLDHVIAKLSGKANKDFGRIISDARILKKRKSLEGIVIDQFKKFYGLSVDQIKEALGIQISHTAKHFAALLTKAVFHIQLDAQIEEFEKAGIITKTVRLEPTELPEQSISFPAFEYTQLVKETWDDSDFKQYLDSKFFIVFFRYDRPKKSPNRRLILQRVMFWNMPESDIDEAKKVWESTISIVKAGRIVKGYKTDRNGNRTRETYFPGQTDNSVAHARPHGSDSNDTYPLPVREALTKATEYTKYCFWINNKYVRDKIYRS